jgi:hypothetical protein
MNTLARSGRPASPCTPRLPRVALAAAIAAAIAAAAPAAAGAEPPRAPDDGHDGQHDFDFLLGRWKVQLRKLKKPLSGSSEWLQGSGTAVVRPLWGGKANIDEVEVDLPSGHVQGMTLRLYSPATRQWSLYWVSQKDPRVDVPTVGAFKDGRGEFYDEELWEGRKILVRYVWYGITPRSAEFEQAFSVDGGRTWEPNWYTKLTRVEERGRTPPPPGRGAGRPPR